MSPLREKWTDERVEIIVGSLLRIGVSIAAVVVFIGGVMFLFTEGHSAPNYNMFRGEPSNLRSLGGIIRSAFSLDSRAIIQFGLLLLVATPVARVAFSVVAFALEHDRMYVIVTLIVLTVLLYSIAAG